MSTSLLPVPIGAVGTEPKQNFDGTAIIEKHVNVFVSGLPPDFDFARLHALFSLHGQILSCKIMFDFKTGHSKGFGFVRFVNMDGASSAISAFHGKKLSASCEKVLSVSIAKHDGTPSIAECDELYIRNVPPHVDDAILQHAFSGYGNIVECNVLRHVSGASRGVAFVRFSTVVEARNAVSHIHGSRPFGASEQGLMARFVETTDARTLRQSRYEQNPVVAAPPQPVYQQPMYYQPVYYPNHPVMHNAPQMVWY